MLLEFISLWMPFCIVGGKPTATAQFLIRPDLSARGLWQSLQTESSSSKAGERWQRNGHWILPTRHLFSCLLGQHAVNLWHGTDGFTSLLKEVVLQVCIALKSPMSSAGFEPTDFVFSGQHTAIVFNFCIRSELNKTNIRKCVINICDNNFEF
jgi:hypothetical protein